MPPAKIELGRYYPPSPIRYELAQADTYFYETHADKAFGFNGLMDVSTALLRAASFLDPGLPGGTSESLHHYNCYVQLGEQARHLAGVALRARNFQA